MQCERRWWDSRALLPWPILATIFLSAMLLASTPSAFAQSADDIAELKAEIEALKQGQATIRKELLEIKRLINQQRPQMQARRNDPSFQRADISVASAPVLGRPNAPVTMIEFTDYQCPFCRRYNLQTKPQIVKDFVETGKLRYVLREFPIANIHPLAAGAAEAVLCAGDQGRYWDMNERLFEDPARLKPEKLREEAKALELDMAEFGACIKSDKYSERVRQDVRDGMAAGVRGTPTFFLGKTNPDSLDTLRATKILRGAQPYGAFKQTIEELLAEAGDDS